MVSEKLRVWQRRLRCIMCQDADRGSDKSGRRMAASQRSDPVQPRYRTLQSRYCTLQSRYCTLQYRYCTLRCRYCIFFAIQVLRHWYHSHNVSTFWSCTFVKFCLITYTFFCRNVKRCHNICFEITLNCIRKRK